MSPRHPTLCCFAALSILLGATPVFAELAARSPFLPPQGSGPSAATEGAPLEYRGMMTTGEGMLFRIFDPGRKMGWWVKIDQNQPDLGFTAKKYDREGDTITVEHQGRSLTLAPRVAKIVSAGSAQAPMPVGMPMPSAVTQSVTLNPTSADEAKRLDAVAAEVSRRRALRDQATQQINLVTSQAAAAQPQPAPPPNMRPQNMGPGGRGPGGNQRQR